MLIVFSLPLTVWGESTKNSSQQWAYSNIAAELTSLHVRYTGYSLNFSLMSPMQCQLQERELGSSSVSYSVIDKESSYFLSFDAANACINSSSLLESLNSSSSLIFRLPSSSVTKCVIEIYSLFQSTPIEVFDLLVAYEMKSSNFLVLAWSFLDTNMNEDLPWNFCDGMQRRLRMGLSMGEEIQVIL